MPDSSSVCSVGTTGTRVRRPKSPPTLFYTGGMLQKPVAQPSKPLLPPPPPKLKVVKSPTSPTSSSFSVKSKASHWADFMPTRSKKKKKSKEPSRPHTSSGAAASTFSFPGSFPSFEEDAKIPRKQSTAGLSMTTSCASDSSDFDDLSFNPLSLPQPQRPAAAPRPVRSRNDSILENDSKMEFKRVTTAQIPAPIRRKPTPIIVDAGVDN
ncbi:hypothetical protein DL96DRAFT_100449 [Flagelloscypha sp. PMI_526]|nr:hypothetical protein DL96DRAFT_100449 [Flagelloscypha sp. PMI_526]